MKIHVGRHHLRRAFSRHHAAGTAAATTDSHLLLLIYAVECGLKLLLLERRGVHSTSKLDDDDLNHDLDGLLKALGARERFGHGTLTSPATSSVSSDQVHQALRYGADVETSCRAQLQACAVSVIAWIRENMA